MFQVSLGFSPLSTASLRQLRQGGSSCFGCLVHRSRCGMAHWRSPDTAAAVASPRADVEEASQQLTAAAVSQQKGKSLIRDSEHFQVFVHIAGTTTRVHWVTPHTTLSDLCCDAGLGSLGDGGDVYATVGTRRRGWKEKVLDFGVFAGTRLSIHGGLSGPALGAGCQGVGRPRNWPLASGQGSNVVEPGETEACAASGTKLFGRPPPQRLSLEPPTRRNAAPRARAQGQGNPSPLGDPATLQHVIELLRTLGLDESIVNNVQDRITGQVQG